MLESLLHESSLFITLTYSDENITGSEGGPTLVKKDYQRWLKRLRKAVEPVKIRYFVVGEYGKTTHRPHYHALIFGLPSTHNLCVACINNRKRDRCDCLLAKSWPLGMVYIGEVNKSTIAYTAQYCLKKLTSKEDSRLQGRMPEFARMSTHPGIGADAVKPMAEFFTTAKGCDTLIANGDVPATYKTDGRSWPLGPYLRGKFRMEVGWEKQVPIAVRQELHETMQHEQRYNSAERRSKRKRDHEKGRWLNSIVTTKGGKI